MEDSTAISAVFFWPLALEVITVMDGEMLITLAL